ncbi:LytR/AlgR family response regulator transcription factor [Flavobacterium caseinilyticum]|uniref:Response regulator transcription factor n=1 Tax=Flavobacterium caseinilyticum TaxID=2541732 RepID=A0A4R5B032_9FLAO|nr:LytTR family DNA-binding domain-containing protein [Flavobacterium caseinilyticum]TDD78365.1 response regulator transcription factor [Flavobacterium caseinilyticum]
MNYSYIIIDDNQESVLKTKAIADSFSELDFVASANNYGDGLNLVLEHKPHLVFLEIDPTDKASNLSLLLINELHRYLNVIPKIIVTTRKKDLAFDAIKYEVADYFIKPLLKIDLVKLILKLNKAKIETEVDLNEPITFDEKPTFLPQPESVYHQKPLTLCIKSYGDYRYIDAKDICYLRADNNSTDIHLNNGDMITAFKTLKHFEGVLSYPFIRIHNSYIVNRNYISRIHNGNSVCYIKNSSVKLPFSKSYKVNIDLIISEFSNENYLEI